ncbi:hypothetical protein Tco_0392352 [Tanacetum coccineum]
MQQPMQNPEDISDPTTAIDIELVLMAKAFTLNDTTPTNNNQRSSSSPSNMQIAQPARAEANGNGINGNQIRCYSCQGVDHYASNCTVKPRKRDAAYLQKQRHISQKEAGIQLTSEEFDFIAASGACEETERANANYTLENNLQQASTFGTQSDKASVYDSDGSAKAHLYETCYDNDIFNIVEQGGGTVEQHSATVEETRAYHESLFHNLAAEVEKVNSDNRKMKETNAELTTEIARYKNQEKCFEISQEKYDKLERVQNFEIQIFKEAAKFVQKFKSLEKEADESLAKNKTLELEIEHLLRAIISQDIMSIVQCNSVVDTSNLQTELERTKEHTLDPLSQKLENENVELEFQVRNYKRNAHLKTAYKRTLRAQLFDKVSERKDTTKGTSVNTQFCKQSILGKPPSSSRLKLYSVTPFPKSKGLPKINESHALSKLVTSNLVPIPTVSKVVKNDNVISLGIFRINPFKASRVDNFVPNKHVKASVRTKLITVS